MLRIRDLAVVCVAVCVWAVPAAARASSLQPQLIDLNGGAFAGSFSSNTDVAVILFSLTDPSRIDVATNSAATGGFDPLLSLFRFPQPPDPADLSLASWIADNDDRNFEAGDVDAQLLSSSDIDVSRFDILDPGLYAVVLTASFNYSTQFLFGQGFAFDGETPIGCELGDPACAFGGTLTITPVDQPTPTPEPGTVALLASGLGALAARRRRRRASTE